MATTQRGINIPVTGQFQDGDDIVDALIAQGMSVDAAIGTAVGEANNYTDAALEQLDIESALIVVSGGTVNLDDSLPVGTLLGYKVTATTTIEGFEFGPGDYVFTRTSDGWEYRRLADAIPIGAVPDDTPPIGGTLATSLVTHNSFRMTVTGASDPDSGLHPSPYRFSVDGGSSWSEWQSSNVYDAEGLTQQTTYQPRAQVRNNALPSPLSTTVSAADVTTAATPLVVVLRDEFTDDNSTLLTAHDPTEGDFSWQRMLAITGYVGYPGGSTVDLTVPVIIDNQVKTLATGQVGAYVDLGIGPCRASIDYAHPATSGLGSIRLVIASEFTAAPGDLNGVGVAFEADAGAFIVRGTGASPSILSPTGSVGVGVQTGTLTVEWDGTNVRAWHNDTPLGVGAYPAAGHTGTKLGLVLKSRADLIVDNLLVET